MIWGRHGGDESGADVKLVELCKRGSLWVQVLLIGGLPWNHNVGWLHTTAFILALAGAWTLRHERYPFRSAVLVYSTVLAASLMTSWQPVLSLKFIFWVVLIPLLVFQCMSQASDPVSRLHRNIIVMTTLALSCLVIIMAHAGADLQVAGHGHWRIYAGTGLVSTFLILATPLLVATALVERGRVRYSAGIALLISAWAAFLTTNRAFWLAWLGIMAWMLLPYIWHRVAWRKWLVMGVVIMGVLAIGVIAHQTQARSGTSVVQAAQADLRPQIWHYWLNQIPSSPWLGHGYGKRVQQSYFLKEQGLPKMPKNCSPLQCVMGSHAHNILIDTTVQTGVLGLLAWVYLLWSVMGYQAAFGYHQAAQVYVRAGQALVLAMIIKNFTDDFMDFEGSLMFWVYWGVLWARSRAWSGESVAGLVHGRGTS